MIVKIVTGPLNYNINELLNKSEDDFIIGVDQGCKLLIDNNIEIDLALGDFDSISSTDLDTIKNSVNKLLTFEKKKDYTDTFLAVKEALLLEPDEIIIYGGLGMRLDHTYANMQLLKLGNIKIINNDTMVYMLDPGEYKIDHKYKYTSFFSIEDVSNLSVRGFKYELENIFLDIDNPLCISNEGEGIVSFTEGLLLVIHQNEN